MKLRYILLLLSLFAVPAYAEDTTTVKAANEEISDNLDLKAVASVFGEAKDLEDFEKRLNDPETRISNLDLNNDGEVDYIRVYEVVEEGTHLIMLQAAIEKDTFQDVATIEVEKDSDGETQVQVVGDVYMYGHNCIYEPVYVHSPVIFTFYWGPVYSPWHSPWYWGYYPPYYHPWHPYPTYRYRSSVHVHINVNNRYNYTSVRKSNTSVKLQNKHRRNDLEKKYPEKSFSARNKGIENKQQFDKKRAGDLPAKPADKAAIPGKPEKTNTHDERPDRSTGRKVDENWEPASKSKKRDFEGSQPSRQPAYDRQDNFNESFPKRQPDHNFPNPGAKPHGMPDIQRRPKLK